jgi:hypothetical protein
LSDERNLYAIGEGERRRRERVVKKGKDEERKRYL